MTAIPTRMRPDRATAPPASAAWLALALLLAAPAPARGVVVSFQEGASGYTGCQDTEIQEENPNDSFGSANTISVDNGQSPTGIQRALIRFDNLFGSGAGQIPLGATIDAASLTVWVVQEAPANPTITLHRMLTGWSEASTWNTMGNGIQFDDVEARSVVDATIPDPTVLGAQVLTGANLVATLQAWSDGATNHGWALQSDNNQNWDFRSSENGTAAERPRLSVTYSFRLAGTVFEDPNYGGGAGRTLAASSGVGRSGARVELYSGAGAFLSSTSTAAGGTWQFTGLDPASYTVRVVNGSVSSSRTGWVGTLLPVQTFRTNASSGSAAAVTDRVGGETPSKADAGNGSTTLGALTTATTTAQSITAATIGSAHITGIDFGFCFGLVVNTNDAGQGSLRQLLTNANALSNAGLATSGRTAGIDHALWMLADGTARPGLTASYASQFTGGVATIAPASALPTIADPVVIDGTTQPGWSADPIVELNGAGAGAAVSGLTLTAAGSTVRGLAVNRFPGSGIVLSGAGATGNVIAGNRIGTDPGGSIDRGNGVHGIRLDGGAGSNPLGGSAAADGNLIAHNGGDGVAVSGAGTGNEIRRNSIHSNDQLGIDLADDGVTANDGAATGGQPNRLTDHPVFASAIIAGGSLTVSGYVGSAPGQAAFAGARVDVFVSDSDVSGHGEGRTYLGSLTCDAGDGDFSGSLAVSGVSPGDAITATATDGSANTSEFGANATVAAPRIVKRAYLADGTPVTSATLVPKGTLVKFLLYLDNHGPVVADVSLEDVLEAGFEYVPGSIRLSNAPAACAGTSCTALEEAAIFAAAAAGTAGSDAVDGDAVSAAGGVVRAGNQSAANAQLDIAAARVWALVFSVRAR